MFYRILIAFGVLIGLKTADCAGKESPLAPLVHNFEKKQHKGLNQNWMITQNSDQFMFFGNSEGLIVYDGSTWRSFQLPEKQIIRAVACDANDRIFTGAFGEFGYWEKDSSSFLQYHSLSQNIDLPILEKEEIWNILILKDQVLFQSFSTIYAYDYHEIKIVLPPGPFGIMFMHKIGSRILLQAHNKGLVELTGDFEANYLPNSDVFNDKNVASIIPFQEESFLVCTARQGIYQQTGNTFQLWEAEVNHRLGEYQINKALALSGKKYAFGTIQNGIYITDDQGNILFHINQENGLQNNTILSLWEDKSRNLWLGLDRGIDLIQLHAKTTIFRDKSGKIGTVYSALVHDGILYLGSNHGIFFHPWNEENCCSNPDFTLIEGTQGHVWEIACFDDQLICSHNEGTFLLTKDKVKQISTHTGAWTTLRHPDQPDVLLQGTYIGLMVYTKNKLGQWNHSHVVEGFSEPIRKICFDKKGNLWAVNPYKGLYHIFLSRDLRKVDSLQYIGKEKGLPSEYNLDIDKLGDRILIESNGHYYEVKDDLILSKIDHLDGISFKQASFNFIPGINNQGFKVYENRLEWYHQDRFISINLDLVSGYENIIPLDSNIYLICIDEGYAIFKTDRDDLLTDTSLADPVIGEIIILGRDRHSIYPFSKGTDNPVVSFSPNQNNLRFVISLPSYPTSSRCRYKLDGYDKNWSEWKHNHVFEYANINHGRYTLMVQAEFSKMTTRQAIYISPYWYQTLWAFIGFILLGLALIFLALKLHHIRLKKHQLKLELEKERALDKQRMLAKNEQLRLDLVNKSREMTNTAISLVQKNEILLKIRLEFEAIQSKSSQKLPSQYYSKLLRLINSHISSQTDWKRFETNFNQVHEHFFKKLKSEFPDITPGDLQLAAFLKLNLETKDIAPLLNISIRGVENKRYRLRKKMGLHPDDNLTSFLMAY